MKAMYRIASAAAGAALLAAASPASAQDYSAYGAYGQSTYRTSIDQCARAAEARVNQGGPGSYGYNQGYGQQGYGQQQYGGQYGGQYGQQGYDPRYSNGTTYTGGRARLVSITRVERRSSGLKISGLIDSGMGGYANNGYGNNGYGQDGVHGERTDPYANRDRYANQGYPGQSNAYGYATAQGDIRFDCRVDYRGYVTSVSVSRSNRYRQSY
ncbi:hypothetical protein [Sphingomonas sp.]|uniref:hypothetical protein n=1 Tax=Sphingomonas sp. TaxID=28214 RepID=UPI00325F9EEE